MINRIALICTSMLCAIALPVFAEGIPSPEEFLGYPIGSRFTPSQRVVDYFRALDEASPLLTVTTIGQTWEGRPLIHAVITAEEHHAEIEAIRSRITAVARPDLTNRAQAEAIAENTPAVVWLVAGVHGSESSSSETAMLLAHRLLQQDEVAKHVRGSCVVVIDPLQNPDGRDRYVNWFAQTRGIEPNADPRSAEHFEPWPGGRYNHYLFDLNRDWVWMIQKETRARVEQYKKWMPQVVADLHEMNPRRSYFFPPVAEPVNANIGEGIQKWHEVFEDAFAAAFTAEGWPFFTRETYDLFYPGYADSMPSLQGAVGMTYEAGGGGSAGMLYQREDGTVLSLEDRVRMHFTTALATLRVAADHRKELILGTWDSLSASLQGPAGWYLIEPGRPNFSRAIEVLRLQGIEVRRLDKAAKLNASRLAASSEGEAHSFAPGTAVIDLRQPLGALAQALLEKSPAIPASFMAEQKTKLEADEEDDFFDVTAWSLAFSHDLRVWTARSIASASLAPWTGETPRTVITPGMYAYLVDGQDPHVYEAAGMLLRRSIRFSVASVGLSFEGREFTRGTLAVMKANNAGGFEATLTEIAAETGAQFTGIPSGRSRGVSLGSDRVPYVRNPKIALVGGRGVDPESFGSLWFALDADTRIPHSVLPAERIASIDLSHYRVIVLPDGSGWERALGDGVKDLATWVDAGGILVAVKRAGDVLRSKDVEISKVKLWPAKKDDVKEEQEPTRENDYRIPGAAFRTTMNTRSFITFGMPESPAVLLEGSRFLLPMARASDNIMTIAGRGEDALVSGFAFPEALERVSEAPYLVIEKHGKGSVITFADDPFFRGYWRATLPAFLNAVLYGPTFLER